MNSTAEERRKEEGEEEDSMYIVFTSWYGGMIVYVCEWLELV